MMSYDMMKMMMKIVTSSPNTVGLSRYLRRISYNDDDDDDDDEDDDDEEDDEIYLKVYI